MKWYLTDIMCASLTLDMWQLILHHGCLSWNIAAPVLGCGPAGLRSYMAGHMQVTCLVELIEMPFTVVACAGILLVNLERVGFNLRNFDMTIIYKACHDDPVNTPDSSFQSMTFSQFVQTRHLSVNRAHCIEGHHQ
jgi:nucleosome binding factor SPN SPT16 subunit